jgi:hypothetical protein
LTRSNSCSPSEDSPLLLVLASRVFVLPPVFDPARFRSPHLIFLPGLQFRCCTPVLRFPRAGVRVPFGPWSGLLCRRVSRFPGFCELLKSERRIGFLLDFSVVASLFRAPLYLFISHCKLRFPRAVFLPDAGFLPAVDLLIRFCFPLPGFNLAAGSPALLGR